jgi:hypothetical protein
MWKWCLNVEVVLKCGRGAELKPAELKPWWDGWWLESKRESWVYLHKWNRLILADNILICAKNGQKIWLFLKKVNKNVSHVIY